MENNWKQSVAVCKYGVRKMLLNARFYIALFLPFLIIQSLIDPIRKFAFQAGYRVTPWLFPFLLQHFYIQMIVILGIILLFCDAPFINQGTPYQLVRVGRKNWFRGQVLYIIVMAFLYFALIVIMSIGLFFPYLYLENGWGKILHTLAQTNAGMTMGTISLDYQLQLEFQPLHALLYSFGMAWGNGVLTGMLIFTCNLMWKRIAGVVVGGVLAATPYVVINFSDIRLFYYFAPPSWMNIMILDRKEQTYFPDLWYGILVLAVLGTGCVCFSRWLFMKKNIDILPEL